MTVLIANVNQTTDTFGQWLAKTNQAILAINNVSVTVNSNTAYGNAKISGLMSANNFLAANVGAVYVSSTPSNAYMNATSVVIRTSATTNSILTATGLLFNGGATPTQYSNNVMNLGNTTIMGSNVNANNLYLTTYANVGNTFLTRTSAYSDAMNTINFYASGNSIVGDNQANTFTNRFGVIIYSQPTGTWVVNTNITSQSLTTWDVYANNLHGNIWPKLGNPPITFYGNTHFLGQNNYFDYGLTSNGDVQVINGARVHLWRGDLPAYSTPTGAQAINSNAAIIIDSDQGGLIQFRQHNDTGYPSGIVFTDNNQGGYLVYYTPGTPAGNDGDTLMLGAKQGFRFGVGTNDTQSSVIKKTDYVFSIDQDNTSASSLKYISRMAGEFRLQDGSDSTKYAGLRAPSSGAYTIALPGDKGQNLQRLSSDGAGNMFWDWVPTINANTQLQIKGLGVNTPPSGVAGEIRATDNITGYYTSDITLKTNVKPIDNALEKVKQINGIEFDWSDEYIAERGGEDGFFIRKHDIGVIAQEVEAVLPEIVATRDDGLKSVKYERIVALLIEAVKELSAEVDELKKNR